MPTITLWRRQSLDRAPSPISEVIREHDELRSGEILSASALMEDAPGTRGRLGRLESGASVLGRTLLGCFFLYKAIQQYRNVSSMSLDAASKGVPAPKAAVLGSGALIGVGALSLLLGVRPKLGAALISTFLLGVTPVMHAFWNQQDPDSRADEQVHFLSNIGLLGGAALAAALPEPWPFSLGNRSGTSGV